MKNILARIKARGEEGLALASSVMLSMFVFLIVMSVGMTIALSTEVTASTKAQAQRINDAESGTARALYKAITHTCEETFANNEFGYEVEVYRSANSVAPTSLDDPSVFAGCPQDGDRHLLIKSTGIDRKDRETVTVSVYEWLAHPPSTIEGIAVINKTTSGALNLNTININHDGAGSTSGDSTIALLNGDIECSNRNFYQISGPIMFVAKDGGINMFDGTCHHWGSLFAKEDVNITGGALRNILQGSIYTLGDFNAEGGLIVQQGVFARGESFFNTLFGSVKTATNDFETPHELLPETYNWRDYNYDAADWIADGWNIRSINAAECNLASNASLLYELRNLTAQTVFDFSACDTVNLSGASLRINKSVAFIGNSFDFSKSSMESSTGTNEQLTFHRIIPDRVKDGVPTCADDQGVMDISNSFMKNSVAGVTYTPCMLDQSETTTAYSFMTGIYGQAFIGEFKQSDTERLAMVYSQQSLPGLHEDTIIPGAYNSATERQIMPNLVYREEL